MSVRVRYAPSPTGDLHIGSLRTVIFNWLTARREYDGTFILRVEDTDQARLVPGSLERQLEALQWMGLLPDEGVTLNQEGDVVEVGQRGPYIQSKRLDTYKKYAAQLLDSGHAYRCFATADELAEMRAAQQAAGKLPKYDRRYRDLSREESDARAAAGEPFVIRHKIPDGRTVICPDIVRGELSFQSDDLDDYVLLKSDGFPTYQLASVVDDHLMDITHVLRGEEWIPSTPKNVLLYEAFGWTPPVFAHLPVILGEDGKKKLSKRDGDVSVLDYRAKGYLPDALFNMLSLLGWTPGGEEELLSREELEKRFDLAKVHTSPAKFSFERLDFVNGWYIRQLPVGEVADRMLPYLKEAGIEPQNPEFLLAVAGALQERFKRFDETVPFTHFFFKRPKVARELLIPKKSDWDAARANLEWALEILEKQDNWTHDALHEELIARIAAAGKKNGEVLWPIRAALTGESASPGAFEMLAILGKEESLTRLQAVLA